VLAPAAVQTICCKSCGKPDKQENVQMQYFNSSKDMPQQPDLAGCLT
jgi:hypothetical protein